MATLTGKIEEKKRLSEAHRSELLASGLTDETIAKAGIYTETNSLLVATTLLKQKSVSKFTKCGDALVFPFSDTYARVKFSNPRISKNKPVKYESPVGVENQIYVPWVVDADIVLVTEGEKKTLCALQNGFACIGLVGVYGWNIAKTKKLKPELKKLLAQKTVVICFDSDSATNEKVRAAENELARALTEVGSSVKIARLPNEPDSGKNGIDDFVVRYGVEAFRKVIDSAESKSDLTVLANYVDEIIEDDDGNDLKISVPIPQMEIVQRLFSLTNGFPRKCGTLFVVDPDGKLRTLAKPTSLFAWIREQGIVVDWKTGCRFPAREELFESVNSNCDSVLATEAFPHFPSRPGVHYLSSAPDEGDGTHLDTFIGFFQPSTRIDKRLLKAATVSVFWGAPYGQIPAFEIGGEEGQAQGTGKTTAVQLIASLCGGDIHFQHDSSRDDISTRLINGNATQRIILIDNVKTTKFSSSGIESLITSQTISGKRHYFGNDSIPNRFIWFITFNHAQYSRDLAQRLIPIRLGAPTRSASWLANAQNYIEQHRAKIIGDIRSFFNSPTKPMSTYSRWAMWQSEIVGRLEDPDEIIAELRRRESINDADLQTAIEIQEQGVAFLAAYGYQMNYRVHMTNETLATVVSKAQGEHINVRPCNALVERLKSFGFLKDIEKNPSNRGGRGWVFSSVGNRTDPVCYDLQSRIENRRIQLENENQKRKAEIQKAVNERKEF